MLPMAPSPRAQRPGAPASATVARLQRRSSLRARRCPTTRRGAPLLVQAAAKPDSPGMNYRCVAGARLPDWLFTWMLASPVVRVFPTRRSFVKEAEMLGGRESA
eukprot:scaffold1334_cov344-Prasinococcus_capsulatus_cf.AAC.7